MNKFTYIVFFIVSLIFQNFETMAQGSEWKTKTTNDGNITVKYRISDIFDKNGKKNHFIEDITTITVEDISIDIFILLMKDIPNHKKITGNHLSTKVRDVSDNEWIIYYYTKNPWPIKNSDCVMRMTFIESEIDSTAIFELVSAPSEYAMTNVNRSTFFNVVYTFKDLGDGKVKITMTGKSSPPVKVPLWLIKAAFPRAPAQTVRRLVRLAKIQSNTTNNKYIWHE